MGQIRYIMAQIQCVMAQIHSRMCISLILFYLLCVAPIVSLKGVLYPLHVLGTYNAHPLTVERRQNGNYLPSLYRVLVKE